MRLQQILLLLFCACGSVWTVTSSHCHQVSSPTFTQSNASNRALRLAVWTRPWCSNSVRCPNAAVNRSHSGGGPLVLTWWPLFLQKMLHRQNTVAPLITNQGPSASIPPSAQVAAPVPQPQPMVTPHSFTSSSPTSSFPRYSEGVVSLRFCLSFSLSCFF